MKFGTIQQRDDSTRSISGANRCIAIPWPNKQFPPQEPLIFVLPRTGPVFSAQSVILFLPCADAALHFFVRNDFTLAGVGKTAFDHPLERNLPGNLSMHRIIGLGLNHLGPFLHGGHTPSPLLSASTTRYVTGQRERDWSGSIVHALVDPSCSSIFSAGRASRKGASSGARRPRS